MYPPDAPSPSLGTIARFVVQNPTSAQIGSRMVQRYALQSEARRLLPDFDVSQCHRAIVPGGSGVDVYKVPGRLSAVYGGLHVCASVWSCPVCASRISERRRVELERGVVAADALGLHVYMATFTFRHGRRRALASTLATFLRALRVMWQRKGYRDLRVKAGLVGFVRALEVTYGDHGWHPHCHVLLFVEARSGVAPEQLAASLRALWASAMDSCGLSGNGHAFDFRSTRGAVADYVAKWGHDAQVDLPWSASAEMTKSHVKQGRGSSRSPFGLLHDSLMGEDAAGALFREYAVAFKGRHQLQWSRGLRDLLGLVEDAPSDEELAASVDDGVWLGHLTREQWRFILGCDLRGEFATLAANCDWVDALSWLMAQGCPGIAPPSADLAGLTP